MTINAIIIGIGLDIPYTTKTWSTNISVKTVAIKKIILSPSLFLNLENIQNPSYIHNAKGTSAIISNLSM